LKPVAVKYSRTMARQWIVSNQLLVHYFHVPAEILLDCTTAYPCTVAEMMPQLPTPYR
jgi:hypothetical protein